MDRRLFLRGVLGIAGAAAVASALRPVESFAGMPSSPGILDELDQAEPENLEGAEFSRSGTAAGIGLTADGIAVAADGVGGRFADATGGTAAGGAVASVAVFGPAGNLASPA